MRVEPDCTSVRNAPDVVFNHDGFGLLAELAATDCTPQDADGTAPNSIQPRFAENGRSSNYI